MRGGSGVRRLPASVNDAEQQGGRDEEGRRIEGEERADRHEREESRSRRPAADRETVRRRPDERVRPLDVVAIDEGRQERAVGRVEVAGRGRQAEGGDDEKPEWQVALESEHGNGYEQRAAEEVGRDHRPAAVEAVGDEPAVEAESERRDAVRKPDGQHAQRPAGDERVPHEREVLEGVAQLARRYREIHTPKVRPPKQPSDAFAFHAPSLPDAVRG
jgi:hypothetical protein